MKYCDCGYHNRYNETNKCEYCGFHINQNIDKCGNKILGDICSVNDLRVSKIESGRNFDLICAREQPDDGFYNDLHKYGYRIANVRGNNIYVCNEEQSMRMFGLQGTHELR